MSATDNTGFPPDQHDWTPRVSRLVIYEARDRYRPVVLDLIEAGGVRAAY
ncbi:MAG: hypothetical protein AB7I38_11585 [Dehalococcoidia bacterium]